MSLVFSHVALNCRDPLATERFYTRHFGFTRARVIPIGEEQIVFLKLGPVYLELFQAKAEPSGPPLEKDGGDARGIRHLAFQVDSVDQTLAAMGDEAVPTLGPLDFSAFIPGWRTVWISDPDGNVVEISQGYTDQDNPPPM